MGIAVGMAAMLLYVDRTGERCVKSIRRCNHRKLPLV